MVLGRAGRAEEMEDPLSLVRFSACRIVRALALWLSPLILTSHSSQKVTYVKKLKVPTSIVGACRLDVAYEHVKDKPHMFQFIPNKEQVKAANKLLNAIPKKGRKKRVQGVPVFTAENLNIAMATTDGIKWYTPYFFDKNLLDNILETSVDQHFQTLIYSRHRQRRHDIIDDGFTIEMAENVDNIFEPVEVQDLLEEIGQPALPLSVLSKAAEIQLLDVVDKVLLGNKWLRKTTGIQPKFPYLVDSFEERTAACFQKTCASSSSLAEDELFQGNEDQLNPLVSMNSSTESADHMTNHSISHEKHRFFGNLFSNPWSWLQGNQHKPKGLTNSSQTSPNPLMPKITMVGISVVDGSQVNEASLKKTMEDLSKSLEQESIPSGSPGKDKDPLFVANLGDYSSITRTSSA
ncbi:hypothetical protein HPP92_004927 [Vanilla planifolia]|uniref:Uncharacterized protein n=1 Tax=Vanilla planifolia TaxID=51239 RepID=A0A835RNQ7_VANPL|nr:hypothetical protein HPP92_005266 [Vanilla planifolia]KAG0493933.1 hypothetical protein HPP92_004927 [Vanilla planifolia]